MIHHKMLEGLAWLSRCSAWRQPVRCRLLCSEAAIRPSRQITAEGPSLRDFMKGQPAKKSAKIIPEIPPYIHPDMLRGEGQLVYLDIYGCQMNISDAEVVLGILEAHGYSRTLESSQADVWLIVTCSIRDSAESKIWKKLNHIKVAKRRRAGSIKPNVLVGILGCMAERVRTGFLEADGLVDVVAGPDSYKDLPRLLAVNKATGQAAVNVLLSQEETYAHLSPIRLSPSSISAFVSIQRGCDNMCSFCIVPFTRGRERSRPVTTILEEVRRLADSGVKEVVLLGQNVNSYRDTTAPSQSILPSLEVAENDSLQAAPAACRDGLQAAAGSSSQSALSTRMAKGFKTIYKTKIGGLRFVDLLDAVSRIDPEMRIRFTSPHPKDFPLEVLELIRDRPNICKQIHLPAQSGNDRILERMRRGYLRAAYLDLVQEIRSVIPEVALTSDFIVGFCGETDEEFADTVSLLKAVDYHKCFMYPYSLREKTGAHRRLEDDVPLEVKVERHLALKDVYRTGMAKLLATYIDQQLTVLVTGTSKRSQDDLQGLADFGTKVIFPRAVLESLNQNRREITAGDYVQVRITASSSETLRGIAIGLTTLQPKV